MAQQASELAARGCLDHPNASAALSEELARLAVTTSDNDDADVPPTSPADEAYLPDELWARVLLALPPVHRLRACAVCRRFKRLSWTLALRSCFDRRHVLPPGIRLATPGPVCTILTSPDRLTRLACGVVGGMEVFSNVVGIVLLRSAMATNAGAHQVSRIWRKELLELLARDVRSASIKLFPSGLLVFQCGPEVRPKQTWRLIWQPPSGALARHITPPCRLVVRNSGDVAILDADDTKILVAPPREQH